MRSVSYICILLLVGICHSIHAQESIEVWMGNIFEKSDILQNIPWDIGLRKDNIMSSHVEQMAIAEYAVPIELLDSAEPIRQLIVNFDTAGRVMSIINQHGKDYSSVRYFYQVGEFGRIDKRIEHLYSQIDETQRRESRNYYYTYDELNRIKSIRESGSLISDFLFDYDEQGRLVEIEEWMGGKFFRVSADFVKSRIITEMADSRLCGLFRMKGNYVPIQYCVFDDLSQSVLLCHVYTDISTSDVSWQYSYGPDGKLIARNLFRRNSTQAEYKCYCDSSFDCDKYVDPKYEFIFNENDLPKFVKDVNGVIRYKYVYNYYD